MNVTGIKYLLENNLPTFESLFLFRNFSEIPIDLLNKYGEENKWAIYGADDRTKLQDNPYQIKKFRAFHVSKNDLQKEFEKLNKEMENFGVPSKNRIFLIWKAFGMKDISFSGIAWKKEDNLFIDCFEGMRPSGHDWHPHKSFKIQIINGKFLLNELHQFKFENIIKKICQDVKNILPEGAYLDFVLTNEDYFFYHDLSLH